MNIDTLLIEFNACSEAIQWAKGKEWKEIFQTCHRGDWLLWLFRKTNSDSLKELTRAKAHCALTVRHLMKDKRSIDACEIALKFADGEATIEQLNAAYYAAAAAYAYTAAASAAYAAAAAAAARIKSQKEPKISTNRNMEHKMTNEQLTDWDHKKTRYQNGVVTGSVFDTQGNKIKDQEINIQYWIDCDGVIMITHYDRKEQAQEILESFFAKTKFYLL